MTQQITDLIAVELFKSRFDTLRTELLDLSLTESYKQIVRYLNEQTGGVNLETLLTLSNTIQTGIDTVERDALEREDSLEYWGDRFVTGDKNSGKEGGETAQAEVRVMPDDQKAFTDFSALADRNLGEVRVIDPMIGGEE